MMSPTPTASVPFGNGFSRRAAADVGFSFSAISVVSLARPAATKASRLDEPRDDIRSAHQSGGHALSFRSAGGRSGPQSPLCRGPLGPSVSVGYVRHAQAFELDDLDAVPVLPRDLVVGILLQPVLPERHLLGVEGQEPPDERLAQAEDDLDRF